MAVNNMTIEQAHLLINAIHAQVTGVQGLAPVDTATFTSVAQSTLKAGYEPVLNAITQVLSKTLIAVRPYSRKFKGLEVSTERWGGIIRKINFYDAGTEEDPTFELVNDQSIDQYEVKKPAVAETRYVGSNVYEGRYTIFTKQLDTAFSSPSEFAAFMSGLMTHFSNEREQWLEDNSRSIVMNMIAAKATADTSNVLHLLTEYNTETGLSLTATTVRQPANFPAFSKWLYARVQSVSAMMTERSGYGEMLLAGQPIMRHTPMTDQRIYMSADFLAHMNAEVIADTYHDNFLRFADVEPVNFWQSLRAPLTVKATPVYINGDTGAVVEAASAVTVENVLGVMFDRDAMGYNIYDDSLETSPYNARGQYYNLFSHVRVQNQNDLTEKVIVLCLD